MSSETFGFTQTETNYLNTVFWNFFRLFVSYRAAMRIKEAILFSDGYVYYCCPRCNVTLDREFVSYCDRCGQKIDWEKHRQAKLRYPPSNIKI